MGTRWIATITYRATSGPNAVEYDIEELGDIETIVERGPDWNTIESIVIKLQRVTHPGLTLEQAAKEGGQ